MAPCFQPHERRLKSRRAGAKHNGGAFGVAFAFSLAETGSPWLPQVYLQELALYAPVAHYFLLVRALMLQPAESHIAYKTTVQSHAWPTLVRPEPVRLSPRWTRPWKHETGSKVFLEQMENPSEVFSVMLIIGGDIVQKAVAQMSGHRLTFIPFSFGWVAYAFNSLMSAFGDGSLMPDPEFGSEVIHMSSGIRKENNSWVLCRLIRDLEREVTKEFKEWYEVEDGRFTDDTIATDKPGVKCSRAGEGIASLLVTMCEVDGIAGKPHRGRSFSVYLAIIVVQHAVAMVPTILYGNWSILFITGAGTLLSILTTSLKEWRLEKYQARRHSNAAYGITRGNGHRHVFIIEPGQSEGGKFPGLFLDDLAGAVRKADRATRVKTFFLALLWVVFLITAGGLKDDTWYLMIVGIVGMFCNVWIAGHHQTSKAHGIPLKIGQTFGLKARPSEKDAEAKSKAGEVVYRSVRPPKTMNVLMEVEEMHPGFGAALLPEFFPTSSLNEDEEKWWGSAKKRSKPTKGS